MGNNFSKNLEYIRKKRGISQERLGELVGVNQTTIARWEKKEISPSIDNLDDVAKALQVTLPDLLIKDFTEKNNEEPDINKKMDKQYKQILKDKGLMDENNVINEESLDKLLKIADMIKDLEKNKEDHK